MNNAAVNSCAQISVRFKVVVKPKSNQSAKELRVPQEPVWCLLSPLQSSGGVTLDGDGIQSQQLGPLVTYIPRGRKSAVCVLMAATPCEICLELPHSLVSQESCCCPRVVWRNLHCCSYLHWRWPWMLPKVQPLWYGRTCSGPHLVPWALTLSAHAQIVTKSLLVP